MKKTIFVWACIILLSVTVAFANQEETTEQQVVIKEGEPFWYVAMEFTGPYSNMQKNIGIYMNEYFKQGLMVAGAPMVSVYYNFPGQVKPEELKWDVGFIKEKDTKVNPPLIMKEFKAEYTAVYMHIGPYNKLRESYSKVFKHAAENGYKALFPSCEKYLNNPQQVKPEDLRTEIIIPLKKK